MLKENKRTKELLDEIYKMFPNACCELNYHNIFELAVATILSAQTTDKSVNKVTPHLFKKYPTPFELMVASINDVEDIIRTIGLYKTKSKNIIAFSKKLVEKHQGIVPSNFDELVLLPGVGRKTANVILVEGYKIPRIPVDTHVERVSKRLGIVSQADSVLKVEEKLMEQIEEKDYHLGHHLLLFFGRYHCLSKNPKCIKCPLEEKCIYKNPLI